VNNPKYFKHLDSYLLERYALRWAAELPGIKSVKLYPYSSRIAKEEIEIGGYEHISSAKYAIVFESDNPKKLWPIINDDRGIYPKLIDAGFADVYQSKPDANFRDDWAFTTSDLANGNELSSIMTTEPHWTLYPAPEEHYQAPAAIETSFIHKREALKILRMTETELMTAVSNGEIKGFDQHRQLVQHWGRYHADQTEDDRLHWTVLQCRVSYFDKGDVLYFAEQKGIAIEPAPAAEVVAPVKEEPENYFRHTGEFWSICFDGVESIPIKAVDGLKYIAYLLERPGESIESLSFYGIVNPPEKNKKTTANIYYCEDSFSIRHQRQQVFDSKTKKEYRNELETLENYKIEEDDLDERLTKQAQIDNRIAFLKKELNERAFKDEPSKKQSLINGHLKKAYKSIEKDKNMKNCIEHLRKTIKTDGALGFVYAGERNWKIIF
jgi:hypothetical protein